jgi:hypothetical protein
VRFIENLRLLNDIFAAWLCLLLLSVFREFFKFQCKKIADCGFKNERSVLYVARRSDAQEEKKGEQAGGS